MPNIRNLVDGRRPMKTVISPRHGLSRLGMVHVFRFSAANPVHLSIAPLNLATIDPGPSCSVTNCTSKDRNTLPVKEKELV